MGSIGEIVGDIAVWILGLVAGGVVWVNNRVHGHEKEIALLKATKHVDPLDYVKTVTQVTSSLASLAQTVSALSNELHSAKTISEEDRTKLRLEITRVEAKLDADLQKLRDHVSELERELLVPDLK